MSSKLHKMKDGGSNAGVEITGQLIAYLMAVMTATVCVAVPLYARDGYDQIGNAKFDIYKNILRLGFVPLLLLAALYGVFWLQEKKKCRLSVTDGCVLAYMFLTILSAGFGGFYQDALWGSFGWNMGLLSQISFVLLYLFLSRFGRQYRPVLVILCVVSAVVFLIGILHRVGIDPIGFYQGLTDDQMAQFLSTMGQATWYASYLIVVLPVGTAVFLYAQKKIWRMVSGIYVVIGFCSLVTQNSDSAYFALAGFMLVLFWFCVEKEESLRRFVAVCVMFFASGKVMSLFMRIRPNPELRYDFMTSLILDSVLTWVLLGICVILYVVLWKRKDKTFHKLIGVGPDCLSSYVAANYGEEAELLWGQKVLTNAHNEWFNMLINGGILGFVSYAGIFVTAIRRFMKAAGDEPLLTGIAAAAVSYMAYNFFCYQQVCCTPFVFILLGIGEYLCRSLPHSHQDKLLKLQKCYKSSKRNRKAYSFLMSYLLYLF